MGSGTDVNIQIFLKDLIRVINSFPSSYGFRPQPAALQFNINWLLKIQSTVW